MVRATAARVPHRPALVDGASGDGVTYAELVRRADRVAALLAERGLGPGDVLAIWLPNLPVWAGVALGAMRAGVAVTGVSPAATDRELAAQLDDSGATARRHAPLMAARVARAATCIAVGDELLSARGPVPSASAEHRAAAVLERHDRPPQGRRRHPPQPSTAVRQFQAALRLGERDTLVAVAPFAHVMGFVPSLAVPLAAGATVVTMPRFDPAGYLELVERHRATVLIGAPPLMRALAAGPRAAARRADRLRRCAARAPTSSGRSRGASRTRRSARAGA